VQIRKPKTAATDEKAGGVLFRCSAVVHHRCLIFVPMTLNDKSCLLQLPVDSDVLDYDDESPA
jgi:hypothetical protein